MSPRGVFAFTTTTMIILGILAFTQKASVPKQPTKDSMAQQNVTELLLLMDNDKNGKISKQEWMTFMEAEFDALDKDKKGQRVTGICCGELEVPLAEAFRRYSDVHGLDVDTAGPFDQVWSRLKETESRLPRSRGLLSRLFRRSRA